MSNAIEKTAGDHVSPFERIKRTNDAGAEFWSSREFAGVLGYGDYRNFEGVIEKAKLSCFNSGHRLEDHFVDITDMIEIGLKQPTPCGPGPQNPGPRYSGALPPGAGPLPFGRPGRIIHPSRLWRRAGVVNVFFPRRADDSTD